MKNFLFVIAVALGFSLPSFALEKTLGIQAGLSSSAPSVSSAFGIPNVSGKPGLMLGANMEFGLTDMLYLQPEIVFVQKGFDIVSGQNSNTTRLNYFEVPVFLKMKFDFRPIRPFLILGPSIGYNISNIGYGDGTVGATNTLQAETWDINFIGGIGGEYDLGAEASIFSDLRYAAGLTNVSQVHGTTLLNNGIEILLGTKLRL